MSLHICWGKNKIFERVDVGRYDSEKKRTSFWYRTVP